MSDEPTIRVPQARLDAVIARHEAILAALADAPEPSEMIRLSRELSELDEVAEKARAMREAEGELAEARALAADAAASADDDADMRAMAEEECSALEAEIATLGQTLRLLLLPRDAADDRSAILEVRAGTGGDEAGLFAGTLFRMYERFAAAHKWKIEILSLSEGDMGGYKEVVAAIKGKGVYARMKYESGVHRVQRVPETESSGRIHTSAATVAVLPEAEDVDIEIRPEDIRIDTMRASGAGGQHVNTTDSAVRMTHLPTGIVVLQSEKSQHQNRARAEQIMRARLYDLERQKVANERAEARRDQIGSGDRSERIRTYNFPQGRVTDHRINLTLYKLDAILDGEGLDEVVDALRTDEQARLLAEFEETPA